MDMFSDKHNNKRIIYKVIIWLLTSIWLAFCLYLSWQTGEETAGVSLKIAQFLLTILSKIGLTPDPQRFHAGLRLFAHFGIFFVTGVLFAASLEVTLPGIGRKNSRSFLIAAGICAAIAVAAEVGKLAVPGRHLTWSETGLNVLGAVCGAALVCLAARLYILWKTKRSRQKN